MVKHEGRGPHAAPTRRPPRVSFLTRVFRSRPRRGTAVAIATVEPSDTRRPRASAGLRPRSVGRRQSGKDEAPCAGSPHVETAADAGQLARPKADSRAPALQGERMNEYEPCG